MSDWRRGVEAVGASAQELTSRATRRARESRRQVAADATGQVLRSAHRPGAALRDLAVMLADGGDALCDPGALRDQHALLGPVASERPVWRTIRAACDEDHLLAIRAARAVPRERAWPAAARPERIRP